jgi:uncharacterized membrane protein (DUF106 family)
MSRIERRVTDLVEGDEEMAEAVSTVKRTAEGDGGSVEWGDVSDEITSGQWGRMIEKEIVVDDEDGGFELADPDAVADALSDDVETDVDTEIDIDAEEPETEGWSQYDKVAAAGAVLIMTGYLVPPVRTVIEAIVNPVLQPLDQALPFYLVLMIVGLATATYSTLLQANLMNTDVIQYQQKRMKALNEKKEAAKEAGDEAAQDALQQKQMEMMGDQVNMFKEQFKPTVWIMFLTIPAFLWLLTAVNQNTIVGAEPDQMIMPVVGAVEWTSGVVGPMQAWIVWYILCSIAFGQIIRKAINVQITAS